MDNVSLKKKLSAYVTDGGYLKNLSEAVLYELLVAWENWTGTSKEFYRSLGFSQKQMAAAIGKAKRLKREGYYGEEDFKQIKIESVSGERLDSAPCAAVEIVWHDGKVIRFSAVDLAIDFLKKVA